MFALPSATTRPEVTGFEVVNLQFAEGPQSIFDEEGDALLAFTKDDYMRFTELGVHVHHDPTGTVHGGSPAYETHV